MEAHRHGTCLTCDALSLCTKLASGPDNYASWIGANDLWRASCERDHNGGENESAGHGSPRILGPVDKPRPDADASDQDESHEAGGELVLSGGDAALLLQMPNEALNP
jgi:hypothetical protein